MLTKRGVGTVSHNRLKTLKTLCPLLFNKERYLKNKENTSTRKKLYKFQENKNNTDLKNKYQTEKEVFIVEKNTFPLLRKHSSQRL